MLTVDRERRAARFLLSRSAMTRPLGSTLALSCLALLAASGCSGPGGGAAGDAGSDADADGDAAPADGDLDDHDADGEGDGDASGPSDEALVFEVDPVATPGPTAVELRWLADDAGGTLTSAQDGEGIRLLKAWTCVDEGATNSAPGIGEQRVCTLRQLASKERNGSFRFDDWADGASCRADEDDAFAEVSVYYHAQKIYELITAPEVGVFDRAPSRHLDGERPVPLNLVANYRAPLPVAAGGGLAPTHSAFFLTRESLRMGMSTFAGLEGLEGDVLAFGQGESADFGYSGEVVAHEFGHFVTHATADLVTIAWDEQGLTNLPRALDEGLANTFAFLSSDQPSLDQHISSCLGVPGFHADNDDRFPDDLCGHPVADGNAILSANWAIYRALQDEHGGAPTDFVRLLLLTLTRLPRPLAGDAFRAYAETFLETMEDEGWAGAVDGARSAFESRGLLATERLVDITGWDGTEPHVVLLAGASTQPWNVVLFLDLGEGERAVATAYVQWTLSVPEGVTSVTLSASFTDVQGSLAPPGLQDLRLALGSGGPITYAVRSGGHATFDADRVIAPALEARGAATAATWTIDGLAPGTTIALHLLDLGVSEAVLRDLEWHPAS